MPKLGETWAPQSRARSEANGPPGALAAIVIAAISALVVVWSQADANERGESAGSMSRLAEVRPPDMPAAIDTINVPPKQLEELRKRNSCDARLAWVTVVRGASQQAGRIRLQSGDYISGAFDLAETPVRVALPYPAPYSTGRGTISVVGTTSDAIVALTPPWHVSAQQGGVRMKEVTWTPASACSAGKE